ncbi:MAG TPA: prolipoprotein diacylglyceryl transferase [Acidimicrobiales bacterium]|nr:prolipoprotein diacylglyceryl transferase [Acidimicrobiales bacterium]
MPAGGVLAYLPSPPVNGVNIGPLRLHLYGLLIALGVVGAVWLAQRRWEARGGKPGTMSRLALWGVPAGIIGARIYSVITSWQADTGGQWWRAFEIWQGGLGIWGGVAAGVGVGLIAARHYGVDWRAAIDCTAPALALAQGIGRWGNYFNQELYGKPSTLPWAVRIAHPVHCSSVTHCVAYPPAIHTFQPTFLYESLWDFACVALIILIERRFAVRKGYLFFVYAALYCIGRFFTERLRVDEAHRYFGLRLNDWTSIVVFAVSVGILLLRGRAPADTPTTRSPVAGESRAEAGAGAGAQNA